MGTMCNLYSITTNQAAIIALFRVINRYVGNLAPMPGVFPDYPAPVIRNSGGELEMTMMRWACRRHREPVDAQSRTLGRLRHHTGEVAQAEEPLSCPGQQLRRIRAGAEPGRPRRVWSG
jgi:putative SOS response-associated peptidase YedK